MITEAEVLKELQIRIVDGRVEITSELPIVFRSPSGVSMEGPAGRVALTRDGLDLEGDRVTARGREAKFTFGRFLTFAREMFQRVEGLFHSRANRARHEAAESWHVRADHARVQARGDVRILGESINLG